jgi:hypothetical protein
MKAPVEKMPLSDAAYYLMTGETFNANRQRRCGWSMNPFRWHSCDIGPSQLARK